MATHIPLQTAYEDDTFTVMHAPGDSGTVVLSFTGIGHALGGIKTETVQREEFVGTATGGGERHVFFIMDKRRHWFAHADANAALWRVLADLMQPLGVQTVLALGNSMGAFGAMIATRHLPIQRSVAFSPQFSVDPEIVPFETRWQRFRQDIGTFDVRSVAEADPQNCRIYVFHGLGDLDAAHVRLFPAHPNVAHYLVPRGGHDVVKYLKSRGVLAKLVASCFADDRHHVHQIMSREGAFARFP